MDGQERYLKQREFEKGSGKDSALESRPSGRPRVPADEESGEPASDGQKGKRASHRPTVRKAPRESLRDILRSPRKDDESLLSAARGKLSFSTHAPERPESKKKPAARPVPSSHALERQAAVRLADRERPVQRDRARGHRESAERLSGASGDRRAARAVRGDAHVSSHRTAREHRGGAPRDHAERAKERDYAHEHRARLQSPAGREGRNARMRASAAGERRAVPRASSSKERGSASRSRSYREVYVGAVPRRQIPRVVFAGAAVLLLVVAVFSASRLFAGIGQNANSQADQAVVADPVTFTVTFAGDCTLGTDELFDPSTSFNTMYDAVGDPAYFFQNVKDLFSSDDLTIVNMEGTLTDSEDRVDKTFAFKGPAEYVQILTEGNVEAAAVANNHSRDYGDQSFTDTVNTLEDAGIRHFGYDDIAYFDIKGVKVALVGTYELDEGAGIKDSMVANIQRARSEGAQVVLVYIHWGIEREYVPNETQMMLGHAAIDAGADLVVGSHPHVIQGYEKYQDRYIVYSLGNFCFGGNSNPDDKDCMVFQQTFTVAGDSAERNDAIKVIPCSVSSVTGYNNYQPTPAEGEEADRILAKIQESNDAIAAMAEQESAQGQDQQGQQSSES